MLDFVICHFAWDATLTQVQIGLAPHIFMFIEFFILLNELKFGSGLPEQRAVLHPE
ncbi:hypothetical protein BDW75DRAFT_211556 [Aspergillus navahoensis]